MNFLTSLLAGLIDRFKVANPALFMIIQFVLGVIIYALGNCIEMLPICATDILGISVSTIQGFLIGLMGILGSRTVPYIPAKK